MNRLERLHTSVGEAAHPETIITLPARDLLDLLVIVNAAEAVDREWRERDDGSCAAGRWCGCPQCSLSVSLGRLRVSDGDGLMVSKHPRDHHRDTALVYDDERDSDPDLAERTRKMNTDE